MQPQGNKSNIEQLNTQLSGPSEGYDKGNLEKSLDLIKTIVAAFERFKDNIDRRIEIVQLPQLGDIFELVYSKPEGMSLSETQEDVLQELTSIVESFSEEIELFIGVEQMKQTKTFLTELAYHESASRNQEKASAQSFMENESTTFGQFPEFMQAYQIGVT